MKPLTPTPEPTPTHPTTMPTRQFAHEKPSVYQQSLHFVAWAGELLERLPKSLAAHNQLDRAPTSILLNIAEGTAKTTAPDRCRYFDTARGSAFECAACLHVLVMRKALTAGEIENGKGMLIAIVSMLIGLVKANDPGRLLEESLSY